MQTKRTRRRNKAPTSVRNTLFEGLPGYEPPPRYGQPAGNAAVASTGKPESGPDYQRWRSIAYAALTSMRALELDEQVSAIELAERLRDISRAGYSISGYTSSGSWRHLNRGQLVGLLGRVQKDVREKVGSEYPGLVREIDQRNVKLKRDASGSLR